MTTWPSREPLRRTTQDTKNRHKREEDERIWRAGLSDHHKGLYAELSKLRDVDKSRQRLREITGELTEIVRLDSLAQDRAERRVSRDSKLMREDDNEDF